MFQNYEGLVLSLMLIPNTCHFLHKTTIKHCNRLIFPFDGERNEIWLLVSTGNLLKIDTVFLLTVPCYCSICKPLKS